MSISGDDVRKIRNNAAGNLTALCFKLVERLSRSTQSACTAPNEQACGERALCVCGSEGGGMAAIDCKRTWCECEYVQGVWWVLV